MLNETFVIKTGLKNFDMKRKLNIILLVAIPLLLLGCDKQATVSGDVKSYFDEGAGFVPDDGAVLYITRRSTADLQAFHEPSRYKHVVDFYTHMYNTYENIGRSSEETLRDPNLTQEARDIYNSQINTAKKMMQSSWDNIVEVKPRYLESVGDDEGFAVLEEKAMLNMLLVRDDPEVRKIVIGSDGRYSVSLPEGEYNFVFVSRGRNRLNRLEQDGQVYAVPVTVGPGEKKTLDVGFDYW